MSDLDYPWTKKQISGNVLEELKKNAKPNCNKCYGRGHRGYRDVKIINKQTGEKLISKQYIPCRCIYKKNN